MRKNALNVRAGGILDALNRSQRTGKAVAV